MARYRAGDPPMLVDSGGANQGTIGTAFQVLTDLTLDPDHVHEMALRGARRAAPDGAAAMSHVIGWAQVNQGTDTDPANLDVLAAAAWPIALGIEVFRAGPLFRTRRWFGPPGPDG